MKTFHLILNLTTAVLDIAIIVIVLKRWHTS